MFELTNELLIRALVFILACFISFLAANRIFRNNRGISLIVGLVVGLFAMLYLDYSRLMMVFDVYGMMAVLLLVFLPALLLFYFLYTSNIDGVIRKMFWIFYGVLSIALISRTDRFDTETGTFIIIIIVAVLGFFVLFDKWVKNKVNAYINLRRRGH